MSCFPIKLDHASAFLWRAGKAMLKIKFHRPNMYKFQCVKKLILVLKLCLVL